MNPALAQVVPVAGAGLAAFLMVRLGTRYHKLAIRHPHRCLSCGLAQRDCRCSR
jgi:hypothetical protein